MNRKTIAMECTLYLVVYEFDCAEEEQDNQIINFLLLLSQNLEYCSVQLVLKLSCYNIKGEREEIVQYIGKQQVLTNVINDEITKYWKEKQSAQLESLYGSGWTYEKICRKQIYVRVYEEEADLLPEGGRIATKKIVQKEERLTQNFESCRKTLLKIHGKKNQIKTTLCLLEKSTNFHKLLLSYVCLNERQKDKHRNQICEAEKFKKWCKDHANKTLKSIGEQYNAQFVQCAKNLNHKPINVLGCSKANLVKQFFYYIDDNNGEYYFKNNKFRRKEGNKRIDNYDQIFCEDCNILHDTRTKCYNNRTYIKYKYGPFAKNYKNIDLTTTTKIKPLQFKNNKYAGVCTYDIETRANENSTLQNISCIALTYPNWRVHINKNDKIIKSDVFDSIEEFFTNLLNFFKGEVITSKRKCQLPNCSYNVAYKWFDFSSQRIIKLCEEHYKGTFQKIHCFAHNGKNFDSFVIINEWKKCPNWLLTNIKCKTSMKFDEIEFRHRDHLNISFVLRDSMQYFPSSLKDFAKSMEIQKIDFSDRFETFNVPLEKIDFPMYNSYSKNLQENTFNFKQSFGGNQNFYLLLDSLRLFFIYKHSNVGYLLPDCNYFSYDDLQQFESRLFEEFNHEQIHKFLEKMYCISDTVILFLSMMQLQSLFDKASTIVVEKNYTISKLNYKTNEKVNIEVEAGTYEGIDIIQSYSMPSFALKFKNMFNIFFNDRIDVHGSYIIDQEALYSLFQNNIRGGLSTPFHRYAHHSKGAIIGLDVNGLYSHSLAQPMPNVFLREISATEFEVDTNNNNESIFRFFDVTVEYPEELKEDPIHRQCPIIIAPQIIDGQSKLIASMLTTRLLVSEYLFAFYKENGLRLIIHKVYEFTKELTYTAHIEFLNKKQLEAVRNNNKGLVTAFKLDKNSLYGKSIENIDKRRKYVLYNQSVPIHEQKEKIVNSFQCPPLLSNDSYNFKLNQFVYCNRNNIPNYNREGKNQISQASTSQSLNFVHESILNLVEQKSANIEQTEFPHVGVAILDFAKVHVLRFIHKLLGKFLQARLLYTDTDSVFCQMLGNNDKISILKELKKTFPDDLDVSFDEHDNLLPPSKTCGLWSYDFEPDVEVLEYVGLGAKSYCFKTSKNEKMKQKGISLNKVNSFAFSDNIEAVNARKIAFDDYLKCYSEEVNMYGVTMYDQFIKQKGAGVSIQSKTKFGLRFRANDKFIYSNKFYEEVYLPRMNQ